MEIKNKFIGVFGMGKSGLAALEFLHKNGAKVLAVNKGDPKNWEAREKIRRISDSIICLEQSKAESLLAECSLVILSPGIPRHHKTLSLALNKKIPIWSEVELASHFVNIPILAVTGTNGKTTVVSLIQEILHRANIPSFVGGNIGVPFCRLLLDKPDVKLVVLELSSFQLESIESFHPHIGVILNIFPHHGERYENFSDYKKAKLHIAKNMNSTDVLILPEDISLPKHYRASRYFFKSPPDLEFKKLLAKFNLNHFKLTGEHNLLNLYIAIKSLEFFVGDLAKIKKGIQSTIDHFSGVPHRLEKLDCPYPFTVFNDAKNSNWEGVLCAIDSINKKPLYLILGGKKRGQGDSIIPYMDYFKRKVDKILLIGETTELLAQELEGNIDYIACYTLNKAVERIKKWKLNGVLLFSPAFPSYDQYCNYQERGDAFVDMLKPLCSETKGRIRNNLGISVPS